MIANIVALCQLLSITGKKIFEKLMERLVTRLVYYILLSRGIVPVLPHFLAPDAPPLFVLKFDYEVFSHVPPISNLKHFS